MEKNSFKAAVSFDYQAQHYVLECRLNVEVLINREDFFNAVYLSIAKSNDIGLYSYQLEVMMDQDIVFSDATGCVVGCITKGVLDLEELKSNYERGQCLNIVNKIIEEHLPNAKPNSTLTDALVEACLAGKNL